VPKDFEAPRPCQSRPGRDESFMPSTSKTCSPKQKDANARKSLQGFPPIAINPLGNTTISVAIGGYYCTEIVIWLQFVCLLPHKI
jgi:hypothetical protein